MLILEREGLKVIPSVADETAQDGSLVADAAESVGNASSKPPEAWEGGVAKEVRRVIEQALQQGGPRVSAQ